MAAMPRHPGVDRDESGERTSFPWLVAGATLGAALAFGGVAAVTDRLGGDGIGMVAGAIVMILACLLSVVPGTRFGALLLAWNGLGIGCALFVIGIFSVGALMIFPLVLIAIALSSWPRSAAESIASLPAIVAQIGGFLLILFVYGVLGQVIADLLRLTGISG